MMLRYEWKAEQELPGGGMSQGLENISDRTGVTGWEARMGL